MLYLLSAACFIGGLILAAFEPSKFVLALFIAGGALALLAIYEESTK